MSNTYITVRVENGVAVVSPNRPESLNALNAELVDELDGAFSQLAADPDVRSIVVYGEKHFAAGADIGNMVEFTPEEARAFSFSGRFSRIEACPKPVIAAIEGFALGGGMELALCCDFRIAAVNAKMGFPEINLGIFPGAGGTQRLARLIGASKAKKMIFTGAAVKGPEALEYGLVDAVADNPLEDAMKLAEELAAKPQVALSLAKQCINMADETHLQAGVEFEASNWARLFATADQKEGMRAFIEKRKPEFKGR
ncbi:MAG: enoyl-CoA hydratase/isomerase family protein [Clostridiales Family XIII bacterium]|jgi:enoyl-CoA hydratase|nr:enoyl-CoA hydratase/isomerase family protein [Clostridiales Family XIII bacterium]